METNRCARAVVAIAAVAVAAACGAVTDEPFGNGMPDDGLQFQVDPFWPGQLPENWILGQVSGLSVDDRDHVWIVHRPWTLTPQEAGAAQDPPISMCCVPAPPVIEFDPTGEVVQAWGGPGDGYDWPESEHGIHVDTEGNVWVGGNGEPDNFILKFSRDGRFLMQIGESGRLGGSNDPTTLGGPAAIEVDPAANEVYVADGYRNRRVIVFDATTGEYRRHWGAYGDRPDDAPTPPYDPAIGASRQFRTPVHGVTISNDGLVYVADRVNNRVQVFRRSGEFVREGVIRAETLSMGAVWDVTLSRDPRQRWLFVPDGTNNTIWILERETLDVVTNFGHGGRNAGQFGWVHNLAMDSLGNVYTSEVDIYKRVQKFAPKEALSRRGTARRGAVEAQQQSVFAQGVDR
jgi:DNA-binding beta-propeller fold protein YncE